MKVLVTIFSKILLQFAIVLKILIFVCPVLSLTIITGQQNFLTLANGFHDRTIPETKNDFLLIWKFFF